MASIQLNVNGQSRTVDAPPMARLLDVLRHNLGLTGTKEGCGEGECGACSIILNGVLVNSCLVPVAQADGANVCTIEGVAQNGELHAVQRSFLKHGGAQCGICTPGMTLAALEILKKNPHPTLDEVREGLSGNLCRCTGYQKIFDAVRLTYAESQ
jgi:carbon-monoxide dehydrogenase small subunit